MDPTSTELPEGLLEDEATSPVVNKTGEIFVTREEDGGEIDKIPSNFASEGKPQAIYDVNPEINEEPPLVKDELIAFPGSSDLETPGELSLGEEGTLYTRASITEQKNDGKLTGNKYPGVLEFKAKPSENEWTEEGWTGGQSIASVGANGPCKISASVYSQIAAGTEHHVFVFDMSTIHPAVIEFGPGGSGCRKGSVLSTAASTISSGGEPIEENEPIPIKDKVTLSSKLLESNALSIEWEFGDGTKQLVSEDQHQQTAVEHVFKTVGSKLEITEKIHTDDLAEPELVTHSKINILGAIEVAQAPSGVTETGATLSGTVNPEGANVTKCTFEYGTSLPSGKTASCTSLPGAGKTPVGVESTPVTGLSAGTQYTFKLLATNTDGTSESATATFVTTTSGPPKPKVVVEAPGSVTETSALLKGTVNPEASEVKSCSFEYGTSLPSGKTVPCTPVTIPAGTSPEAVSATVMGLTAGTKYTFKLTATNTGGSESATGAFETTTAAAAKPKLVVEAPGSVTETSALLKGTVNPEASEVKSCSFEYGTSLPSGTTAACSPASIGSGTSAVSVTAAISGLSAGTSYSVKLAATNGHGATVSTTVTFTTAGTPPGGGGGVGVGGGGGVGGGEMSLITPPPGGGGGVLGNKAVSPVVTLSGTPTAVSKVGAFALKLHCATGATSCTGTITLKTSKAIAAAKKKKPTILTLAIGSFSLSGGQLESLTLHLSSTARAVLARTHVLSTLATIVARDATAETATTKASFSLHPAKAAKKH